MAGAPEKTVNRMEGYEPIVITPGSDRSDGHESGNCAGAFCDPIDHFPRRGDSSDMDAIQPGGTDWLDRVEQQYEWKSRNARSEDRKPPPIQWGDRLYPDVNALQDGLNRDREELQASLNYRIHEIETSLERKLEKIRQSIDDSQTEHKGEVMASLNASLARIDELIVLSLRDRATSEKRLDNIVKGYQNSTDELDNACDASCVLNRRAIINFLDRPFILHTDSYSSSYDWHRTTPDFRLPDSTTVGRRLRSLYRRLHNTNGWSFQEGNAKNIAIILLRRADELAEQRQTTEATVLLNIASDLAKIAEGELFLTGLARDVFEVESGRNLLNGEVLSPAEEWQANLAVSNVSHENWSLFRELEKIPLSPKRLSTLEQADNEWKVAALKRIGVDRESSRHLKMEEVNRRITAAYAALYSSNRDIYKWAGMAAYASHLVGEKLKEARNLQLNPGPNSLLFLAGQVPTGFEIFQSLRIGNLAVFDDIYWQHLAYQSDGIAGLEKSYRSGEITELVVEGWRRIAEGEKLLGVGRTKGDEQMIRAAESIVWKGNEMLLRYEQGVTLQNRVYDRFPELFDWVANWPSIVPVKSPIPEDQADFGSYLNGGKLQKFSDRWEWIEKSMLPAWKKLDHNSRNKIIRDMKVFEDDGGF